MLPNEYISATLRMFFMVISAVSSCISNKKAQLSLTNRAILTQSYARFLYDSAASTVRATAFLHTKSERGISSCVPKKIINRYTWTVWYPSIHCLLRWSSTFNI